jgi:uncharacterized protein (TIGR04255 family)
MWKMFQAENAIEMMGIQIRFSEPLPSLVANRVLRSLEPTTSVAGLINRQPVQGFNIDMQNPTAPVTPISSKGMVFQKTSLVRLNDQVVNQLASQVEFQPTHIGYATWMYKSWTKEKETIAYLLNDALKIAFNSVAVSAIRIEYLDRFVLDEDSPSWSVKELLNETSDLLPSQIFDAPNMFHSHTGRFDKVTGTSRRLHLVHVDAQELTQPEHLAGRKSISMLTAAEDQFLGVGLEIAPENAINIVEAMLVDLHASVLDLFKKTVNSDFAQENELPS